MQIEIKKPPPPQPFLLAFVVFFSVQVGDMDIDKKIQIAMASWESGDLVEAERILLEAAHAGSGLAAHNLGTLYTVGGPGIEQSKEKGRLWYEISLASGFEKTIASDPTWFRNAT